MIELYEDEGILQLIYGPYPDKTGRNRIVLYYPHRTTTITYARYLMQNKIKRKLTNQEEVDHIDDNFLNDNIENLQILTHIENVIKSWETRPAKAIAKVNCTYCNNVFDMEQRKIKENHKRKIYNQYCSKSCLGKQAAKNKKQNKKNMDTRPNSEATVF